MRSHRRRRTVTALVVAVLVLPAICWVVLGMPPVQAMLVGALAAVVAAVVRFPPDGFDPPFPEPPTPVRDRGARREAFRLSWNVAGREDRVGSTLILRLQQVAARRLADRGLDLHAASDRDAIVGVVGQLPYRVLRLPPGGECSVRAFGQALAAVERLADPPRHPHRAGAHPPTPQESTANPAKELG